ncbi:MAG: tetratricopeptide repeat protein [Ardenticatenaceae bacterium]|nr:tetratricopeptide repeat protein [Ardenticatenaceae bacterium]
MRFLWAWLLYTWGGLHRYFGIQNSIAGEFERAVHYFGRAYQVDPTFRAARLHRGILLGRELGRIDEAIADFDALLAEDPTYSLALFNRAMMWMENGRYPQALADMETYLAQSDPSDENWNDAQRIVRLLREED